MNALQRLTIFEKITASSGIVLLIGMFAFPWYHVGIASITVGGHTFGGESFSANVLKGPGSFFSIVALIVLIALLAEFAIQSGTRCVVARIFNIIGKRETNAHVVPELVGQLRRGQTPVRLGNLESRRDYTDVTDVAAALHRLLSSPHDSSTIFNVGSGRSVSVGELVQLCEQVLGRPVEVESEPQRRRTQDRLELAADPRLLRETTGWEPARSLQETLSELLTEPDES